MKQTLPVGLYWSTNKEVTGDRWCKVLKRYCATVTSSSATVPSGQYAKYDSASSKTICSVDANLTTSINYKRRRFFVR